MTFGPQRQKPTEGWKNYIEESIIVCSLYYILLGP
jgi:hypothetical protein